MKFIEIVDGFSIRVDSIVSVKREDGDIIVIETENREYKMQADFYSLMRALDSEDEEKKQEDKYLKQYFGG